MKTFIFYSTAGEGHKKIADAIREEFNQQGSSDVHGFDAFETALPVFRNSYPATYFFLVKYATRFWGFLYNFSDLVPVAYFLAPLRALWNRFHSQGLRKFIRTESPALVITTHFYAAEVIASAKKRGEFSGTLITVITDSMPHAFWINPGTDYYWVMCEENKQVLIKRGVPDNRIVVGGIPVSRQFLEPKDPNVLKRQHQLQHDRFTILFTSGSFGLGPTEELLNSLTDFQDKVQAVVVCGRNQILFDHLKTMRWNFPVAVTGFTDVMHEFMSIADIMIAKSGGSTMCESLVKGLPMMISAPIPGQETRNRDWLFLHKAALNIQSIEDAKNHIRDCLKDSGKIKALKTSIRKIAKPNAAFDLVKFASQIKFHDKS